MFSVRYIEERFLVDYGNFPGDFRTINCMKLEFIFLEEEEVLFEVMDYRLMSRKLMPFILSGFISSMFFSYVVSVSNAVASIMMFILIC